MNFKDKIFQLYPEYSGILFWQHGKNKRQYISFSPKIGAYTQLLARVRLEIKIGRRLVGNETVDHIDDNPLNDNDDNLQILSHEKNCGKTPRKKTIIEKQCNFCKQKIILTQSQRKSLYKGAIHFYCGKSCSARSTCNRL